MMPFAARGSSIFQKAFQGFNPQVLEASLRSCEIASKALRMGSQANGILKIRLANKIPENEKTNDTCKYSLRKLPNQLP